MRVRADSVAGALCLSLLVLAIGAGLFVGVRGTRVAGAELPVAAVTQLLNGQSALSTTSVLTAATMLRCRETAVYIDWSAGTSAGAVTIETAATSTYAGTWAPLQVVAWSAVSKEDVVQITGVQAALRTRISTAIVGGTVSTWLACN